MFSFQRLSIYLKKYFTENRTHFLAYLAVIVILPVLYSLITPLISECYTQPYISLPGRGIIPVDAMWNKETNFFIFMFIFLMACAAGGFYIATAGKAKRVDLFTLPVSDLEKFITFFIYYALAPIVLFSIGVFIADTLRVMIWTSHAAEGVYIARIPLYVLTTMADYTPYISVDPTGEAFSAKPGEIGRMMFTALICSSFILQSVFALGSIVWPKNSILKTFAFGIILNTVCLALEFYGFKILLDPLSHVEPRFDDPSPSGIQTIIITVTIPVVIFTYWLSYLRFKEQETIDRW